MKHIHGISILTWFALLLLAGCSIPGTAPQIEIPPQLIQQYQAAARQIQDAHLQVELLFNNTALQDKQVLEIWYARPDSIRIEILESTQPAFQDIISASRGNTGWTYRHAARQVDIGPVEQVKPAITKDLIDAALEILWKNPAEQVDGISLDYVNGEWAFRLPNQTSRDDCTLWLDTDSLLPIQLQCKSTQLGQYAVTIHEAEYNTGLTGELFDLSLLPSESYIIRSLN